MEYSATEDKCYCYPCRNFPPTSGIHIETAFTKDGFSNWKTACEKGRGFKQHGKSQNHIYSMNKWAEFKKRKDTNTSILQTMNAAYAKTIDENRHYLKVVCEVLLFTATQSVAQRGHRETSESDNRGNFVELMSLIATKDPIVLEKMGRGNSKYLAHSVSKTLSIPTTLI
jgi:hypothetical protein